jgi:16S rRNA (guanine966-N2)-methyltransferase
MRIVGGTWGGRRIEAPPGRDTRPTTDRVREAWMSAVAPELPDANVLDLFAGSGALGLEALSRGAARVTFVEKAPAALRILERNIADLAPRPDRVTVVRADAIQFILKLQPFEFDIAFADPPYEKGLAARLVEMFTRTNFTRLLCIEHAPGEKLPVMAPVRQRRYGDTVLTFLSAENEA